MQVVSFFQKDGFFSQFNALGDDAFLGKPKPVDDPDKGIYNAVFPIVVGGTFCSVVDVCNTAPCNTAAYDPSAIESTALRTLNAVRKGVYGLFGNAGMLYFALFQESLNLVKGIPVDKSFMGTFCVYLIFAAVILFLLEGDGCSPICFLVQTVANVFFIGEDKSDFVCPPFFFSGFCGNFSLYQECRKLIC